MGRFLKSLYKLVIPNRIRECKSVTKLKFMILGHDSIYTRSYYRDVVEDSAKERAVKISQRSEVIPHAQVAGTNHSRKSSRFTY